MKKHTNLYNEIMSEPQSSNMYYTIVAVVLMFLLTFIIFASFATYEAKQVMEFETLVATSTF